MTRRQKWLTKMALGGLASVAGFIVVRLLFPKIERPIHEVLHWLIRSITFRVIHLDEPTDLLICSSVIAAFIGSVGGLGDRSLKRFAIGALLSACSSALIFVSVFFCIRPELLEGIMFLLPVMPIIIACGVAVGTAVSQEVASKSLIAGYPQNVSLQGARRYGYVVGDVFQRAFLSSCLCAVLWFAGIKEGGRSHLGGRLSLLGSASGWHAT